MTITIIIVIVIMSLPLLGHGYGGVLLSLGSIEKKHLCRNMTCVQRECVDASHVHRDTVCVWTNVNMLTCGCVACVCSRKKIKLVKICTLWENAAYLCIQTCWCGDGLCRQVWCPGGCIDVQMQNRDKENKVSKDLYLVGKYYIPMDAYIAWA